MNRKAFEFVLPKLQEIKRIHLQNNSMGNFEKFPLIRNFNEKT